jgi:hypothetical protein
MCDVTEFKGIPSPEQADGREPIKHVLYGSKAAIALAIATLHVRGYAETREWSKPLPTPTPGEYMSILRRLLWLEDR